jgi:hypothetical protein
MNTTSVPRECPPDVGGFWRRVTDHHELESLVVPNAIDLCHTGTTSTSTAEETLDDPSSKFWAPDIGCIMQPLPLSYTLSFEECGRRGASLIEPCDQF